MTEPNARAVAAIETYLAAHADQGEHGISGREIVSIVLASIRTAEANAVLAALTDTGAVMTDELRDLLARSKERFNFLTSEQRAAEMQAQREGFVLAFTTPCEHGELDFETCPKCGVYGSEREQTV